MIIDSSITADGLDNLPEIRHVVDYAPILHQEVSSEDVRFVWHVERDNVNRVQLRLVATDSQLGQAEHLFYPGELRDTPGFRFKLQGIVKTTLLRVGHYRRQFSQLLESTSSWIHQERHSWLIERVSLTLHEKDIGRYECNSMTVRSENKLARFEPVGCLALGADGRMDIFDEDERYVFLLHGEAWFLQVSKPEYHESRHQNVEVWHQFLDSVLQ